MVSGREVPFPEADQAAGCSEKKYCWFYLQRQKELVRFAASASVFITMVTAGTRGVQAG